MAINVVCLYWSGKDRPGWADPRTGSMYVNRLFCGVERNLTLDFNFYCFTDQDLSLRPGIIEKDLNTPSYLGCLPKLSVFNSDLKGRTIIMDIDLIITGNLDEMFSYDGYFMTRSTFVGPRLSGGDIVFFDQDDLSWVGQMFLENTKAIEKETGGRERFVYRNYLHDKMDFVQDKYPDQLFSYKRHVKGKGLPKNARIVSCHGNPRPDKIKEKWVREHWRCKRCMIQS